MYLKYLDIQGFKSFPDKTRVTFNKGLTAVVGPNGSGKSNISDAVRWVMGEQSTKNLRGDKMEDVIFTGTKTRKSQGFAEVSITMDNTNREFTIDSDEVTLTRKYYRSGESEYMINRSNVRLKDINELFMDTGLGKDGYSLVGQGKIAEIVRAKSTERREIFEEAAGISKFRYRKLEAEKSLAQSEENLLRLTDILTELEDRIAPLQQQSEKATQFLSLSQEKKILEVSIWNNLIEKSNQQLKDQSDKIIVAEALSQEYIEKIEQSEQEIQTIFQKTQQCNIQIESLRTDKSNIETQISDLQAKIAVSQNNIQHSNQDIVRIESEISNSQLSDQTILQEITKKKNQIEDISNQIEQLEQIIQSSQQQLSDKLKTSEDLQKQQDILNNQLNTYILEQSKLKINNVSANSNLEEISKNIVLTENQLKNDIIEQEQLKTEEQENIQTFDIISQKLLQLNNMLSGQKIKLDSRNNKLFNFKQQAEEISLSIKEKRQKMNLLEGLEASLEGFSYSVKEILKRAKNGVVNGVLGTVSQLINVKAEYSTAIETALGISMQNVVVQDESSAKSAIHLLVQQNLGRATFLPITSVKGIRLQENGLENFGGYIGIASDLVEFEDKYQGIINSLLGRTIIVDDIDSAVIIAKKYGYKFRIVTLDGQIVNAGGSFTGGSKGKTQGFLSRKNEISALENQLKQLEQKQISVQKEYDIVKSEVSSINAQFTALNSESLTLNEDKIRLESEQKRVTMMLKNLDLSIKTKQEELSQKVQRQTLLNQSISQDSIKLTQVEKNIQETANSLSQLQEKTQSSIDDKMKLSDKLSQIKINVIEKNKDIQSLNQSIEEYALRQKESKSLAENLQNQKDKLLLDIQQINESIQAFEEEISLQRKNIEQISENTNNIIQQRQALEQQATSQRQLQRQLSEEKEKASAEVARLTERHLTMQKEFDEVIAKLWDEYELTKSDAQKIAVKLENIAKANSQLTTIKSKIKSLGNVNVSAIEEYKQVSERYNFLSLQIKDAQKSKNELLRLINELTLKMQDIFSDNFEKINANFKEIFVELFGGGQAELRLTDTKNVLECGIEIFVEPPGKIIKNLASLSGGEQAFVAIAIYFAILKVRPAPFCILDEIEAALDDVNVSKYAAYLRTISDNTQFIMITHRRGTMEEADVLYGVTMQDEGVSKLLRLDVAQAQNIKGVN